MDVGFHPDDRIGSYRVETELGCSGSGILLQAKHVVLPRRAIIKVVHTAFAAMQSYAVQTLREACILEAVAHPGVPIVYESGVLRDRRPWFAFEWVAGPTLEDLLSSGPVSVIEVAGLVRDLAEILEHAHRRGVIHRGLRPDRIVIAAERRYPLCIPDWSDAIAHDATAHAHGVASEDARCYLAPELAAQEAGGPHEPIDDRADMFALGVIAYRALTGRLPGRLPCAPGNDAALHAPAQELRPDAPPELAALIESLLAFDRFDRPSASEVRGDVDWLFETLPALQLRARSKPALALVPADDPPEGTPERTRDPLASLESSPVNPANLVLLEQPRLRRPKWTPAVRYLEMTPVDNQIPGDDRAK
jgi:eukaryotic-like serine/threonine-protein kinase